MPRKIKIGVAIAHAILRKGFVYLLEKAHKFSISFEVATENAIILSIKTKKVDLIFLDTENSEIEILGTLAKLSQINPKIKVIVFYSNSSDSILEELIKFGSCGILNKNCGEDSLNIAIDSMLETGYFIDTQIISILPKLFTQNKNNLVDSNKQKLNLITEREKIIISLLCKDFSNKRIADQLSISIRTVENHRQHIKEKTGCKSLIEIIRFAKQNSIASIDNN